MSLRLGHPNVRLLLTGNKSLSTTRPEVAEGGTQVQIGVRVLDLIEIDDVKQAMTLDFVLFARWQDGTLDSSRAVVGSGTEPGRVSELRRPVLAGAGGSLRIRSSLY